MPSVGGGAGLAGFAFPEQRYFPRYYRFTRRWATGQACRNKTVRVRPDSEGTEGRWPASRGSRWCSDFEGGLTVERGSPWRSFLRAGLTIQDGSRWGSNIPPGLTVRQGSQWRSRFRGGPTVEQGSRWASKIKNWRFAAYDPSQFPRQRADVPPRLVRNPTLDPPPKPWDRRLSAFTNRVRVTSRIRSRRAPWGSRLSSGRRFGGGTPWAKRRRY